MQKSLPLYLAVLLSLVGCTSGVPYRDGQYSTDRSCDKIYRDYDFTLISGSKPTKIDKNNQCWNHSREVHQDYDLLFVEFDDQGWVQGADEQTGPSDHDHLSNLYNTISYLHRASIDKNENLTFVVFVHGWQHSADALDSNVHSFRKILNDISNIERENIAATQGANTTAKTRVVGLYIGWRGKSLAIPYINSITFWERKNTAENVAQGTVQELLRWLDLLRDTGKDNNGKRNVHVLTIGHSFGGLITFEALSGELLRNSVRFNANECKPDDHYMSRVGDLVIIVNPAFEGSRYEPLRAAGHRLRDQNLEHNQLPVVIIATSEADWATRYAFPAARVISTLFESTSGEEWWSNVAAIGHNSRYITHKLSRCKPDDWACQEGQKVCDRGEYSYISELAKRPAKQYLCDGLYLQWAKDAHPDNNPFWVVQTTGDIMKDHGDIFNPAMIAFVKEMYKAFISTQRAGLKDKGQM